MDNLEDTFVPQSRRVSTRGTTFVILLRFFRLLSLLLVLCIISFAMVRCSPIDPVRAYMGADMLNVSAAHREKIAEYWGLNQPPLEQFRRWASALLHGNFGTSLVFRRPVVDIIKERFLASLALMGTAWLLSGVFGFALGVIAGMRQDTWLDRAIKWYCYTLASTPTFWLGLVFLVIFAFWLNWLPFGMGVPAGMLSENVTLMDRLRHLILPAMTLSVLGVSVVALHTRAKLLDVLASEYVLFAKARGETSLQILIRHGLRNIILPAITLQFTSFSELFGGAVLAEQVFSYPGLGRTIVVAGLRSDIPLLLGIVLFSALFVFSGNMTADILYSLVDPRIKERRSL